MVEIRRSTCKEVFEAPAFEELMQGYSTEVVNPDLAVIPDREMYERMESLSVLHFVGLFDDDGKLVGVCVYVVSQIPHFKGRNIASVESLWVTPALRPRGWGLRLIHAAKRCAKEDGAMGMFWGAKEGTAAAKLFERIATPMDRLFWMKL